MEQFPSTTILMELLPADAIDADPALISALGRDIITLLREHGETVQSVYRGQRGGELLLQIMSPVWANKDIILSDLSSLVTILTPVVLIAQHLRQAYSKRVSKEVAQQHPVSVTLEIKGVTLTIETADVKDAEALATLLAQQILVRPSATDEQVLLEKTAKVQAYIPKRSTRKRR
jgi:hypothetical protein